MEGIISARNATDSVMELKIKSILEELTTSIHQNGSNSNSNSSNNNNEYRSSRYQALGCLGELLSTPHRQHADKLLFSLVDRVAVFAEGANSLNDFAFFLSFLSSFLDSTHSELRSNIDKIIPKLVSLATRLSSRSGREEFGVNILLIILQSSYRNLATQQCSSIREALFGLVMYASSEVVCNIASHVIALTHSLDAGEAWTQGLLAYSVELVGCLKSIGMPTSEIPSDYLNGSGTRLSKTFENKRSANLRGLEKTIMVKNEFRGVASVIQKMISIGCSGGFPALDLTLLLPLERTLLSTYIRISPNDTKIYVDNDQNVSLLDLASVSSDIKTSFLSILESILASRHSSLVTIANSLLRPLAIVLGSDEMKQASGLANKALSCFQIALQLFPTVISKNTSLGLDSVVNLFESSVEHLTKSDSSIQANETTELNGYNAENGDMRATAASYSTIFATIERTLLFCGPQLSVAIRNPIEIAIGKLLIVVNKGIAHLQFADRRMKFLGKELIRTSFELQNSLLSLALADILSSGNQSGGVYSSNITLLSKAAALCLRQNETSVEAAKVIQALDLCMHPTSIPLMSAPLCMTTESFVKNTDDQIAGSTTSLELSSSNEYLHTVSDNKIAIENNKVSSNSIFDSKEKTESFSSKTITFAEKRTIDSVNSTNSKGASDILKKNRTENSINNSTHNHNYNSNNSSTDPSSTTDTKSFSFQAIKPSVLVQKMATAKDEDLDELPDLE